MKNDNKKILMIAAFGKGDDGMSFASCMLRDVWIKNNILVSCVDFFDNGGSGVGVSALNKILATFKNKKHAKKQINNNDAIYFTPKLSPLGFISLVGYYKMCIKHKKPYTLHIHGRALIDTYNKNLWIRPIIRKYITSAKCNIALTNKLRDEMCSLFKCGIFKVAGNFAEDEMMINENEKQQKLDIINSKPIQICYMSNIIESKGIFELICAIGSNDDFILKIAGRIFPDEKTRFENALKEHSNIEFLGFVTSSQKRKLLMESAVFCLPTRYPTEAQPISIIEALCMGCIVIATDLPGIADTLGENYPLYLYVEKDTKSIKDTLNKILDDPQKAYDEISPYLKYYQAEFSLSIFAQKIYDCVVL